MCCSWDFNKIFNPTDEQTQKHIDFINNFIKEIYEKHGECCSTCKHSIYVQASPFYDYRSCEFDRSLEIDRATEHHCKKYEFVGYLRSDNDERP